MQAEWLRISEEINALDYLEQATLFLRQTESSPLAWKWVIIALHGALYGFAICAAHGTSYDSITYVNKKGEHRLIAFEDALKLCQDASHMRLVFNRQPLRLSDQQKQAIAMLQKELRNSFEHYVPNGWSIELHGLPDIVIDVLQAIRSLALELGDYTRFTDAQTERVRELISTSILYVQQTKLYQDVHI